MTDPRLRRSRRERRARKADDAPDALVCARLNGKPSGPFKFKVGTCSRCGKPVQVRQKTIAEHPGMAVVCIPCAKKDTRRHPLLKAAVSPHVRKEIAARTGIDIASKTEGKTAAEILREIDR